MSDRTEARLVDGPVGPTLARLTAPMILGSAAVMAFNVADTFFLGRYGADELAAITLTFPVVMAIANVAIGLGVGCASVVSRAIGAGDRHAVRRLTTDSLLLAVPIVALISTVGFFTIDPVFRAIGASPDMLPLVREYMQVWYLGMVFVVVPMVGNSAIRATGDMLIPGLIMVTAFCVNLALDPLLIFGIGPFPELGLKGAAVATVFARATTLTLSLCVLHFRERLLVSAIVPLRVIADSWRSVLRVSVPAATARLVVPVSMGVVTRIVASHGPEPVAAFGVATRVEFFVMTTILALSTVVGPFVGQNWGAGKPDRVGTALRLSNQFAVVWGAAAFVVLFAAAAPIAACFSRNQNIIDLTTGYLRMVPAGLGLSGVLMICVTAITVLNRPLHATALVTVRAFGVCIPLALVGSRMFGPMGVFGAVLCANVVGGIGALFLLRRTVSVISE